MTAGRERTVRRWLVRRFEHCGSITPACVFEPGEVLGDLAALGWRFDPEERRSA
jgi:hypothetical protein